MRLSHDPAYSSRRSLAQAVSSCRDDSCSVATWVQARTPATAVGYGLLLIGGLPLVTGLVGRRRLTSMGLPPAEAHNSGRIPAYTRRSVGCGIPA